MRARKPSWSNGEQRNPHTVVGNSPNLWGQKAYSGYKKVLIDANFRFDPYLIAAIVRRNPQGIKACANFRKFYHNDVSLSREILRESQYEALRSYYGTGLLSNPIKLAMRICNSDTTETTKDSGPTRYDILHCLAVNFDGLVESARQKGHLVPDLAELLQFAMGFNNNLPLHTFILGLSEENKEIVQSIFNPKAAVINF